LLILFAEVYSFNENLSMMVKIVINMRLIFKNLLSIKII